MAESKRSITNLMIKLSRCFLPLHETSRGLDFKILITLLDLLYFWFCNLASWKSGLSPPLACFRGARCSANRQVREQVARLLGRVCAPSAAISLPSAWSAWASRKPEVFRIIYGQSGKKKIKYMCESVVGTRHMCNKGKFYVSREWLDREMIEYLEF